MLLRRLFGFCIISFTFLNCHKENVSKPGCDMHQVYADNADKLTISNGIWGTVAFMEGDCMPGSPTTCKTCPVKRTIRIYQYTRLNQARPETSTGFYDRFNTELVKEFASDDSGFFQLEIPAGDYTIIVVENGKLYSFGFDGQGGISPLTYAGGKQKVNLTLTYKAAF